MPHPWTCGRDKAYVAERTLQSALTNVRIIDGVDMDEPLFYTAEGTSRFCALPNFEYFDNKMLSMRHYRINYLWEEYRGVCLMAGERPYALSTFQTLFSQWRREKATKRAPAWYPAELMQCYWSVLNLRDAQGALREQTLFVALLPYSDYAFAYAVDKKSVFNWMRCCIKAYRFFGGVPHVTECDFAKRADCNHNGKNYLTLQAFSEHYRTVLFYPRPKRKEAANDRHRSLVIRHHLRLAKRLREELDGSELSDLSQLNMRIERITAEFNSAKRDAGPSRKEVFELMELPQLLSLPETDYDMAVWFERSVAPDYHFQYKKARYSVPYRYVFEKVYVRLAGNTMDVYCMGDKIATHEVLQKTSGKMLVTDPSHRPGSHRRFTKRFEIRFMPLAREIGPATGAIMHEVLSTCRQSDKGFRPCKDLLDLRNIPSGITLEQACAKVLENGLDMTVETVSRVMREGTR